MWDVPVEGCDIPDVQLTIVPVGDLPFGELNLSDFLDTILIQKLYYYPVLLSIIN